LAFFSIIAASPLEASAAAFASVRAVAAMGRQATLVSEERGAGSAFYPSFSCWTSFCCVDCAGRVLNASAFPIAGRRASKVR